MLHAEAKIRAAHLPQPLECGQCGIDGVEVRSQQLVPFHAQVLQDVAQPPEVEIDRGRARPDRPRYTTRSDAVAAVGEVEPPRGAQDGRSQVAAAARSTTSRRGALG